ncbi:MAG: valine--tRNA ligase [Candidatus Moranbacteria bacterium]|nr:valine--tRNA ligase [Candidatus Moranbacteria bacterium]
MEQNDIPKAYDPKEWEDRLYRKWEESGFFNPDICIEKGVAKADASTFSVLMPPPNVTGVLHLGHAMENAIMDVMARSKRMRGFRTLYLPGADHAAVATQSRVEKNLVAAGMTNPRQELGREGLLGKIREFADDSKATITRQVRAMGSSCDWSRFAYTFDGPRAHAVNTMFKKMYDDGLIYKGYRVVNWSVKGQSTCSDDELEHIERPAKLYTFRYSADFPIPVATTRPETKLGDTAVAVHPEDTRYKDLIGKTFEVEIGAAKPLSITIIGDEEVDPSFGTGAVGVTPAHSQTDFDIRERHPEIGLVQVIGADGKMTLDAGREYRGLDVLSAREKFVTYLRENDLLEKEEDIVQNVGTSDRFGDVVEVLPMEQWFVAVNREIPGRGKTLKDLMREAVTTGLDGDTERRVSIQPERFEKVYLHWIDNLRDWCISRQIWWGHRIPVWYDMSDQKNGNGLMSIRKDSLVISKDDQEKIHRLADGHGPSGLPGDDESISVTTMTFSIANILVERLRLLSWEELSEKVSRYHLEGCEGKVFFGDEAPDESKWIQDPDTLDTWFSSGLWSFSTLGWPDTGAKDLMTFHPTSFMQMGYEILFFWMARMILMTGYGLGTIPFRNVYIHGILRDKDGRKFSKSLGNGIDPIEVGREYGTDALRLALLSDVTPGNDARFSYDKVENARNFVNKLWNIARYVATMSKTTDEASEAKSLADRWILGRLATVAEEVSDHLDAYRFSLAIETLRSFTRDDFADWYVEIHKIERNDVILRQILDALLRLWHPFIPFVTEAIYGTLGSRDLLLTAAWPEASRSATVGADFEELRSLVIRIRNLRAIYRIDPTKRLAASISTKNGLDLSGSLTVISRLARVEIADTFPGAAAELIVSDRLSARISLESVIDIEAERTRLDKELAETERYAASLQAKLENPSFAERAPEAVVAQTRSLLDETRAKAEELRLHLGSLV